MKKLWNFMFAVVLIFSLVLPCFAAKDTMSVTNATAEPGDIVYLTVTLNEKVVGNTAGIDCKYDPNVLKPVPASSSWSAASTLEDFNKKGGGVWASKTAQDLKGTLCVVAFQVLQDVTFTDTTVSCTVMVKNDEKEVGTYTADALITYDCDHVFGDWKDQGTIGHTRTCSGCEAQETQSHEWDEGKTSANPDGSNTSLLTHTCTVCGATKVQTVAKEESGTIPTIPEHTHPEETYPELPTKPTTPNDSYFERPTTPTETEPEEGRKPEHTDNPSKDHSHDSSEKDNQKQEQTDPTQFKDYNQPAVNENGGTDSVTEDDHSGHFHEKEDLPIAVPINPENHIDTDEQNEDMIILDHEGHDHAETSGSVGTVCAVLGVLLILVIASVWFLKKKR